MTQQSDQSNENTDLIYSSPKKRLTRARIAFLGGAAAAVSYFMLFVAVFVLFNPHIGVLSVPEGNLRSCFSVLIQIVFWPMWMMIKKGWISSFGSALLCLGSVSIAVGIICGVIVGLTHEFYTDIRMLSNQPDPAKEGIHPNESGSGNKEFE